MSWRTRYVRWAQANLELVIVADAVLVLIGFRLLGWLG